MDATYDEALLHAPCGQGLASFEFGNLQVTRDNLVSRFPDDEARIDRYLRLVKGSETAFPMYVLSRCLPRFLRCLLLAPSVYFDKTTREVIDGIFRDSRDLETIRGVLSYLYGDYGLPPGESAFVMTALVMNHYLHGGAFYPSAGPQSIAEALVPTVLAAGGAVWVRARVDRILVERGSVVGVAVRGCEIRCRTVISAVGAENTYFSLLRQHDGCAAVARGRFDIGGGGISRSCAMFTVFVGLDSPASQLGLPAKNSWVFPSWDHDQNMRRWSSCRTVCFLSPAFYLSVSVDPYTHLSNYQSVCPSMAPAVLTLTLTLIQVPRVREGCKGGCGGHRRHVHPTGLRCKQQQQRRCASDGPRVHR